MWKSFQLTFSLHARLGSTFEAMDADLEGVEDATHDCHEWNVRRERFYNVCLWLPLAPLRRGSCVY